MDEAARTLHSLGVDWYKLGGQLICFAIIMAVLWRYAYKPVLAILQQRRERIAESVTNADKIKAELASTELARQEILNKAAAQANKMIEEARQAAARVQEQETQKAIAQAEQIIAKARDAAAADHARMLGELKKEVGALVAQTTAAVTGKILTPEDQRRLAEETRRQLAA
jgi:F-type H+-transporting ATPase subunit b